MGDNAAENFKTTVTKPQDFDAFWQEVLEQAANIPLNPQADPVPLRSTAGVDVYEVHYDSLDHVRIAAWYCVPRGKAGPFPAIIRYPGYVSEPLLPKDVAAQGYVVLSVAPRGKLRSNQQFNPGYPGLLIHNIVDRHTYGYRGFYVDAWRAVDFLLSRKEVDRERIAAMGNSQGGGLTIVTAAMHPEVKAGVAGVPFLCGMMDAIHLTRSYPYQEINDYLRLYPEREEAVRTTLAYFDGISFAPKIRCPMLLNIGLKDDVCPPETGYAVYKAMRCPKELHAYPECGHDGGGAQHAPKVTAFLEEHLLHNSDGEKHVSQYSHL